MCKILEMGEGGTRALVEIVPRLDPNLLQGADVPTKYPTGSRPPAKTLNRQLVTQELSRRRHPMTGEMLDYYDGEFYTPEGLLIRDVNAKTMLRTEGEDMTPTLEELKKFSSSNPEDDLEESSSYGTTLKTIELVKGDTVRVIEGDLVNLMGIVVGLNAGSDTVKVMPLHEEIRDTILDFQHRQLMKYVKVGDHVKVIMGRYAGETGTVVSLDESSASSPIAIVLSDSMAKEIQVRVRDVQESAEISKGLDSLKGKELYDLVALAHGDVGVITHVGRDSFKIMCQNGSTRDISDQEIQRKLQSNRAAALDKVKNHITPGEMVSVVDGPHQGQSGTIKHIYRSFVFLHNNKMTGNAGIFVVKSR